MLLKDFIPHISKKYRDVFFSGISFNASKVKKNNIFFALKGNKFDGNDFIDLAIKKGAKIIISEKKITLQKKNVIFLNFHNPRKLLAEISYKIFNKRPKKILAVTGTNGKSSVADFYYQILNLNSKKVASIGTIGIKSRGKKKQIQNTTLDPITLSSILNDLKNKKIDYVILEASSHGLEQNRLDGLLFDTGIFTNLSHDHLDYHKNMKSYFKSKLYLFDKLIAKKGNIITDAHIPQFNAIRKISLKKNINLNLIFNKKKGIELISHRFDNEKQILKIRFNKRDYKIVLNLIGKIQIKNMLMSILAAYQSGLKFEKITNVIHKIKPVEGRLEKIGKIKNKSRVILDYAHTPEALEMSLQNIKEQFPDRKISLVFGCGGERDQKKRFLMGKIAERYSDKIYLTDDNPRKESPSKIRMDIKKGIKKIKVKELPDRKKAIHEAVMSLNTGELLLVAGKGHEKIQDYGNTKLYFSDQKVILNSIKNKNKFLSNDLKMNIIRELSNSKIKTKSIIKNISINSKMIKKDDVFFAIKGKRNDGNNFVAEAFRKKTNFAIVNKINKNYSLSRQIKVRNSLSFLSNCASIFRKNINAKIISITGSCGKTSLKEMVGNTFKKISKTTFSPKSFNNKYGVPVSLFNLKQNDEYGVFEVGMDKRGEIDNLTKIIKPDLGVITNISYAHSKNFESINKIAEAKAEIIKNITKNGTVVLNKDDYFYNYHKKLAVKKELKIISFGINNKSSMIKLIRIKKKTNRYEIFVSVNGLTISFYSYNDYKTNIYNILGTIAIIQSFVDIKKLKKNIFLHTKVPNGRGDISRIKIKNKQIFLIDESYNSNPLSLRSAIENFDKLETKGFRKILLLGDMLELGKHSVTQHRLISKIVNKTKINKVYVVGKYIKETFKGLKFNKKAKILDNKFNIVNLIDENFKNNDHLMIKGSNSTGLYKLSNNLKQRGQYVI